MNAKLVLVRIVAVGAIVLGRSTLADQLLFDFGPGFQRSWVEARDATIEPRSGPEGHTLHIQTGHKTQWPGITLKCPQGRWDLSAFEHVALAVKNTGANRVEVHCRVDSVGKGAEPFSVTESIPIEPGAQRTLTVTLRRRMSEDLAKRVFGMRGYPGGVLPDQGIDPRQVTQILLFVARPREDHAFAVGPIRAAGSAEAFAWMNMPNEKLFPMIDRYGQYRHRDWPGKTHSDADLKRRRDEEAADLAAHPGPNDWNQYGGWTSGPQLEATGFFRVEKYQGKWWLVDPEGRLFWSHGVDCVRPNSDTPITDREHYFEGLPDRSPPWDQFFSKRRGAAHGYYQEKSYEQFNFYGANRLRKYGEGFQEVSNRLAHQRLRSWAMNTIGNWSGREVCLVRKTPYVGTVQSGRRPIEGSTGYWGKFPDPFDPSFQATLRRNLEIHRALSTNDPWCLGYFVDNELSWGDEFSLAEATLRSPADQPAKRAFLAELQSKYTTIQRLNQAWGTQFASWDALLESRTSPDRQKAQDDLGGFSTRIAEQYFRICRDEVRRVAPKQLYLGCRFAWRNDRAVRAAAKYCDVVSFNVYRRTLADFRLPEGVDRPVIIGEFHFGALDRGMFHPGLVPTANQSERAAAYQEYVYSGLAHPAVVGTHWFQYVDQATTGRDDGENYQIGLVDICDTPYPETIAAVRRVGSTMYAFRMNAKTSAAK